MYEKRLQENSLKKRGWGVSPLPKGRVQGLMSELFTDIGLLYYVYFGFQSKFDWLRENVFFFCIVSFVRFFFCSLKNFQMSPLIFFRAY